MFLVLASIGYILLGIAFILDKVILTKSVDKPIIYTFYSTIIMFGVLCALPFTPKPFLVGIDWWWAIISGCAFGFALWTLYSALQKGEASHIHPFNGAVVTIATYALATNILGESLTSSQHIGIVLLAGSSLLFSFEKSKFHNGVHIGFLWAMISGILFAVSHITAKYLYSSYDFLPAFIWTRATTGVVGMLCLLSPAVWRSWKKKKTSPKKAAGIYLIFINKAISILAVILIQYAAAIGSVAVVFALAGLQYAFLFLGVLLLSKYKPRWFKEDTTTKELVVQGIAVVLLLVGSIYVVF